MPIYDFRCSECGEKSEILIRTTIEKESPACAKCGSTKLERLLSAPHIAKERAAAGATRCGNTTPCCGKSQPCDHPPCH
jgi:putative FmdB family regulatory protein